MPRSQTRASSEQNAAKCLMHDRNDVHLPHQGYRSGVAVIVLLKLLSSDVFQGQARAWCLRSLCVLQNQSRSGG